MEWIAITLLLLTLVLGCAVMVIFLKFLNAIRDNHKLFRELRDEIKTLSKKVDGLARTAGSKAAIDQVD